MTATTVLGPGGYSRPPYGSFAGKPPSSGRVYTQQFTVLGPNGYSRPPYGSFAGRTPATGHGGEWLIRARRRGRR